MRVIAEAGQCMEGDVAKACDMAKHAAKAGAWGFKVQLLTPDRIAAADSPTYWDRKGSLLTQRETFRHAGVVPYQAWRRVVEVCELWEIEFLATPFDIDAVRWLAEDYGCNWVKVASGDITNPELLREIGHTDMKVILSTGASSVMEINQAIEWLGRDPAVLLACSLIYPTQNGDANLGRVHTLQYLYPQCEIGYSDHTLCLETALVAAGAGATWLERHYTLGGNPAKVPDHAMALNPDQLAQYVQMAQLGEKLYGHSDIIPSAHEYKARQGARRSLWWADRGHIGAPVPPIEVLRPAPDVGSQQLASEYLDEVAGKHLVRPVEKGDPVRWSDFDV